MIGSSDSSILFLFVIHELQRRLISERNHFVDRPQLVLPTTLMTGSDLAITTGAKVDQTIAVRRLTKFSHLQLPIAHPPCMRSPFTGLGATGFRQARNVTSVSSTANSRCFISSSHQSLKLSCILRNFSSSLYCSSRSSLFSAGGAALRASTASLISCLLNDAPRRFTSFRSCVSMLTVSRLKVETSP